MSALPVRIDVHVRDIARAQGFYSRLLGWTFEPFEDGMARIVGRNGDMGMMIPRNAAEPAPGTGPRGAIAVFAVANCDRAYETALSTGGAEALPPADYDKVGRLAYVEDGEGNLLGLLSSGREESAR